MTAVPGTSSMEQDLDVAAELLRSARSVLLLAHKNPDADSLGSALALALTITRAGGRASVTFDEPESIPPPLRALPGIELVRPAADWLPGGPETTTPLDLIVVVDCGAAERVGRFEEQFHRAPVLMIDHHASNTRFGDHQVVDPQADATVVLVRDLLRRLGVHLDRQLADLLYAGLATDTGNFRHCSASSHVLAAELMNHGVEPDTLLEPISETHPFGWQRMLATVLGRAELDPAAVGGRGLVHTFVTREDLAGLRQAEAEAVIDIVRTCAEAAVAMVCKQSAADTWQVSLRARHGVPVGAAATLLGGGGHPQAAGFTWIGEPSTAVDAVVDALSSVM